MNALCILNALCLKDWDVMFLMDVHLAKVVILDILAVVAVEILAVAVDHTLLLVVNLFIILRDVF